MVTPVTNNGGAFRSFRNDTFITGQPKLGRVRTRLKSPGQNGSRERGFESLKNERLCFHEVTHGMDLT